MNKKAHPKFLTHEIALKTPIFTVEKQNFLLDDSKEIERWVVKHPGAVVILPLSENNTVFMAKQYRFAALEEVLEFPAGCLDKGEAPLACAKRELAEELNLKAEAWEFLGEVYASPGFTDERLYLFLAKDLSGDYLPADEDEQIDIVELSVKQLEAYFLEGKIKDAKSHAIFSQARLKGDI